MRNALEISRARFEGDNKALVENGKEVAKEVWTQLRSQAGESGALEGIQGTVQGLFKQFSLLGIAPIRIQYGQ